MKYQSFWLILFLNSSVEADFARRRSGKNNGKSDSIERYFYKKSYFWESWLQKALCNISAVISKRAILRSAKFSANASVCYFLTLIVIGQNSYCCCIQIDYACFIRIYSFAASVHPSCWLFLSLITAQQKSLELKNECFVNIITITRTYKFDSHDFCYVVRSE